MPNAWPAPIEDMENRIVEKITTSIGNLISKKLSNFESKLNQVEEATIESFNQVSKELRLLENTQNDKLNTIMSTL